MSKFLHDDNMAAMTIPDVFFKISQAKNVIYFTRDIDNIIFVSGFTYCKTDESLNIKRS